MQSVATFLISAVSTTPCCCIIPSIPCDLQVITPSADGPADKAGIKPRDGVIAIDGKPTAGASLYDAGDRLQGPEGSQVMLSMTGIAELALGMIWKTHSFQGSQEVEHLTF